MKRLTVLAIGGAVLVASGVGLVDLPAGLVVGGAEMIGVAYIGAYLGAKAAATK